MLARGYRQTLTYWARTGTDGYGEETFAAPAIVYGRKENKQENIRLLSGEETISKAVVYAHDEVAIGGYIAEGDLTASASPITASADEIRAIAKIPSLRSNTYEYRAYL